MLVPDVGGRLPVDHTRAEDHSKYVIPFRQGEGCYRLIEKPCPDALVVWRETMNQEPVDVGPVHAAWAACQTAPSPHLSPVGATQIGCEFIAPQLSAKHAPPHSEPALG